jgi:SAM-dependent methyltransferase
MASSESYTSETQSFYDDLASDYHLVYPDWDRSIERQAAALDTVIQSSLNRDRASVSVLDCSCGIGTQTIGLAKLGYRLRSTDLSPAAVARAKREADARGHEIAFSAVNMLDLDSVVQDTFDDVLSCDNALSHIQSDEDLTQAIRQMSGRLKPDGLLMAGIQDHDLLAEKRPRNTFIRDHVVDDTRVLVFQIREWFDNPEGYDFEHFIMTESDGEWTTRTRKGRYRAWKRAELSRIASDAGLSDVTWHSSEETGYFEWLLTARKN